MNITQSCQSNNEECRLLCNSPSTGHCLVFSGNFIDGTPCGFHGYCYNGECQNGGVVSSGYVWFQEHTQLVTLIIVSSLLFAIVVGTIVFWYIRRNNKKKKQALDEYPTLTKVDSTSSTTNLLSSDSSIMVDINTPHTS